MEPDSPKHLHVFLHDHSVDDLDGEEMSSQRSHSPALTQLGDPNYLSVLSLIPKRMLKRTHI